MISPLPEPDRGGFLSNLTRAANDIWSQLKRTIQTPFGQETQNLVGQRTMSAFQSGIPALQLPLKDLANATIETGQSWGDIPGQVINKFQGKPPLPVRQMSPSAQRGLYVIGMGFANPQVIAKSKAIGRTNDVLYHGTKAPIKSLAEADVMQYGDPQALYGKGLYLTDNPAVAAGYAKNKGIGEAGKVLSVKLQPNVNLLDLDQKLPDTVASIMEKIANSEGANFIFRGKNGQVAMKEFMNSLGGISKYEGADIIDSLQYSLEQIGYDGFRHTGGQITGGTKSNVSILWDTGNKSILDKIIP